MAFLSISDMAAAAELGADLRSRTFPDDVPEAWYRVFRDAGWSPVPTLPDAETVKAQAQERTEAAALAAQVEEMSFEAFCAARTTGWQPGQPLPGAEET
jgi:hypothetical protein